MPYQPSMELIDAVKEKCHKLSPSDPDFAAWLLIHSIHHKRPYFAESQLWDFWSAPTDLALNGAPQVLAPGKFAGLFTDPLTRDVYVIGLRRDLSLKDISCLPAVLTAAPGKFKLWLMQLADPILRWGEKACPTCLGKTIVPCSNIKDAHIWKRAPVSGFCNDCNNLYPPRRYGD